MAARLLHWFDAVILDLARQMRWSFVPPLLVYVAYGASGITAVVNTFVIKDYLDVSAAFIAGVGFWAGLPWALKMPLGHLVDLMWRQKAVLVWVGAALMAASFLVMHGLAARLPWMDGIMGPSAWFVLAAILAPCGYVIQDAVADAMSVDAVPRAHPDGTPLEDAEARGLHTTMQTLGRFALIGGASLVAALNIYAFDGLDALPTAEREAVFARIYLWALVLPCLSVAGVTLAGLFRPATEEDVREPVRLNHWYFTGGAAFVALSLAVGLGDVPFGQEIIFAGSMTVVLVLMRQLLRALPRDRARMLVGTAIIVFIYRAVPLPGAGQTWFEIDVLGFDPQFLSVLSFLTALLTLAGLVVLRPMMAEKSIAWIVVVLTIAAGLLSLPNIGLYYGLHTWTAAMTGDIVDARFIAILDTAVESPLGQIAMIPMLAWIARNAPDGLKATFFAVMASFTNLALSASTLATRYVNEVFIITREVTDPATGAVTTAADYSQLGLLLICVAAVTVVAPLLAVFVVQRTPLRTTD